MEGIVKYDQEETRSNSGGLLSTALRIRHGIPQAEEEKKKPRPFPAGLNG
jgi:hypothetical protein